MRHTHTDQVSTPTLSSYQVNLPVIYHRQKLLEFTIDLYSSGNQYEYLSGYKLPLLWSFVVLPCLSNIGIVASKKSKTIPYYKGKGKALPRTGYEGPEGEQMYSSTLSSTSALDAGGWSTPRPGRFTSGKDPVPIV